jgi:hypothetical protein
MAAIIQLILAVATLISSLAILGSTLISLKRIKVVHEATNSKMDKLLALTEKASFAAGVKSVELSEL